MSTVSCKTPTRRQRTRPSYNCHTFIRPTTLIRHHHVSTTISTPCRRTTPLATTTQHPARLRRFAEPVPAPKPHEIFRPSRGRDSKRRARDAEYFRKYIYLRRQLKPWSDSFKAKHGRTPSLIDAHDSEIPGLVDRFREYLEALEQLRFEVQ